MEALGSVPRKDREKYTQTDRQFLPIHTINRKQLS